MNDVSIQSILQRNPSKRDVGAAIRAEEEQEAEYKAFSFGRVGNRPQIMFEIRKSDGYCLIIPYMDLHCIYSSNADKGFILECGSRKITVEGKNLAECLRYFRENRIAMLIEVDRGSVFASDANQPIISQIIIGKLTIA